MNYERRIEALRTEMNRRRLYAYVTTADANWEYLAGIPRLGGESTKHRQHSSQYTCLLVTMDDVIAFMPHLNLYGVRAKLANKKAFARFITFPDGDIQGETITKNFFSLGLCGKAVGVSQDVNAALVLLLQEEIKAEVSDHNDIIFDLRAIKDEQEISLIRRAVEITDQIFKDILNLVRPGVIVRDIEWEIDRLMEEYGASTSSFSTSIYTGGGRPEVYFGPSDVEIKQGSILGLDYGVMYRGYCTDFGRTIFVGEPSTEDKKIYELVVEAQSRGLAEMYPGSCGERADAAARKVLADEGYGDRFIHKLGHGIGMDVHECPFLAPGETTPFKPGMIFTVEPSVYIPEKGFIRVEDEVLITSTGCEIMSSISHDLAIV